MTFKEQIHNIQARHPGMLLLFRMGDFFELFGPDAIVAAKTCGLTLTTRTLAPGESTDFAGFPHHSLELNLHKLLKAGHRVAVCEPVEADCRPKNVKRIVVS